jgi:hypothetical protein
MINNNKIIVPSFFQKLPKVIQDLIFEFNWKHRKLFQKVLIQLIEFTHCSYCYEVIGLDIVHKIKYCCCDCLYYSFNDKDTLSDYDSDNNYDSDYDNDYDNDY